MAKFLSSLTVFHPSDFENQNIEYSLQQSLFAQRKDKALIEAISEIFDSDVEGLQSFSGGTTMLLYPEYGLPIDVQGDGMRFALRCLIVFSMLKDTVFIIEEPENHQHPRALARFAKALCAGARDRNIQTFITTHSLECVHSFVNAAKECSLEPMAFFLDVNEGVLDARKLFPGTIEALDAENTDIRYLDDL
ncbi:MAG: ATP-binding protein [Planctomycetes bacterium]|nr:ATP-binding protein [Planctomycetota bacterium]